jgi:hypothetical protein
MNIFGDVEAQGAQFVGYEESARLIAGYIRGSRLSRELATRTLDYLRKTDETFTATEVIALLANKVHSGATPVLALIFFEQTVSEKIWQGDWMRPPEVRAWAEENGRIDLLRAGHHGAIPISGIASDKWQLEHDLAEARQTCLDRLRLITGSEVHLSTYSVTDKFPMRLELNRPRDSAVRAAALDLSAVSLPGATPSTPVSVGADLLMAGLRSNKSATRAALLWAVFETLLSQPGVDNVECAELAADIASVQLSRHFVQVAMSMVRGKRGEKAYAASVKGLSSDQEMDVFIHYLNLGSFSTVSSQSTRLALEATAKRLTAGGLREYRDRIAAILKHLYRQRNMAIHGGVEDGPMMARVAELSAPIASALVHSTARHGAADRQGILAMAGAAAYEFAVLKEVDKGQPVVSLVMANERRSS